MPIDLIKLEGMVFYGYHGVNEEEKLKGQKFVVDIDLFCDLSLAGKSDDLSDTINYSTVYRIAKEILEGESYNLLEALAEKIANSILSNWPRITVKIKISKPDVPIKGSFLSNAAIEITRKL
ncbi:MAG: dihydroneopterin aldolase [SAR202 cluster bacterium]|nr:dihydroneopterin aldolase [Chloroflexota bacterium]MQG38656.1 dihydroneopterin aldolase [SAR202 cluster bacterium]|tara:strand:+ start:268 stop:633 length:366 start_codon:yes stop_codon:yes gene_type:complete